MPLRKTPVILAVVLLGFAVGIARHARGAGRARTGSQTPSPTLDQSLSPEERTRVLAKGKELFLARCASCHDERGGKPLKSGPPLNERGLSVDEIARAVNGRLGGKSEEERRAVTLYISSLMKTKESGEKPAAKPPTRP
jgi:mono/diheme cytochrome c family protein